MNIRIENKDALTVCGYCVETTLAQNDKDVSVLYADFFGGDKENRLLSLNGAKKGYYGLSWYTKGHERYCYLLGLQVAPENAAPENTMLKEVPAATYARTCLEKGTDIIKAWNEFFYNEIPKNGWKVNEQINAYYEFYPDTVDGDYELWVPVVKADV